MPRISPTITKIGSVFSLRSSHMPATTPNTMEPPMKKPTPVSLSAAPHLFIPLLPLPLSGIAYQAHPHRSSPETSLQPLKSPRSFNPRAFHCQPKLKRIRFGLGFTLVKVTQVKGIYEVTECRHPSHLVFANLLALFPDGDRFPGFLVEQDTGFV